jgi:hypothetical protein
VSIARKREGDEGWREGAALVLIAISTDPVSGRPPSNEIGDDSNQSEFTLMLSKIDENDSEAKRISLRPFLEGCEIEEAILEDILYLQLRITTDPPSPISSLYVAGERGVVVKGSSRS